MPLKLELKAGERIMLGDCLIINEGARTRLCIAGPTPVLRERDMLLPKDRHSLAEQFYLVVQGMYLAGDRAAGFSDYRRLAADISAAVPTAAAAVAVVEQAVCEGRLFNAMRQAQAVVELESAAKAPRATAH